MVRVKSSLQSKKKHRKVLKATKGYWMSRSKQFKKAHEAMLHAGQYAFMGRKLKKRAFRKLWITRLNAALKSQGTTYSKFINLLRKNKIELDRKILAKLAVEHPKIFDEIVTYVSSSKKAK
jgi:large subunit ribosomal protein L20